MSERPGEDPVEQRIAILERQVVGLRNHTKLRQCFWAIVFGHWFVMWLLFEGVVSGGFNGYTGIPIGGICVLAVWYAWTNRPIKERLSRALLAVGAIWVGNAANTQRATHVSVELIAQAGFLLLGAFGATYAAAWLTRVSISPPRSEPYQRPAASIRSIMLMTVAIVVPLSLVAQLNPSIFERKQGFDFFGAAVLGLLCASISMLGAVIALRGKGLYGLLTLGIAFGITRQLFGFSTVLDGALPSALGVIVVAVSSCASFYVMEVNGYRIDDDAVGRQAERL